MTTPSDREDPRCAPEAGRVRPVVDRNRCEAKGDCVPACPCDVFEIRLLTPGERSNQSWIGWIKTLAHGGRQAFAAREGDCHACGLCVKVCPEQAIRLERVA